MDKGNPRERKLKDRWAVINPWGSGRMNIWSGPTNWEDSPAPAAWDSLSEAIEKKNNPFLRMLIKQEMLLESWEDDRIEAC